MDDPSVTNPFDAEDRNTRRSVLLLSLAVVVLCCCAFAVGGFLWFKPDPQALIAQYFPSSTPTASPTLTRTPTPKATATSTSTPTPNLTATAEVLQATDTAVAFQGTATSAANWKSVTTDTFDSNKNKWLTEAADDEFSNTNYQVVDGKYRWEVTAHKPFMGWVRVSTKKLGDFYVSFDIQQVSGPDTADFGVVFREDNDGNLYYFAITNNGQYAFYEYNSEWSTLIEWTETDLIKKDEVNRITVVAEGSQFTFFINDQYLASFTDEHLAKGTVALAIELANENDEAVFEFDNVELRVP